MSVLSNNTVDKQNLEDDWDSQVNGEIKWRLTGSLV
jgi:hypothetical protein